MHVPLAVGARIRVTGAHLEHRTYSETALNFGAIIDHKSDSKTKRIINSGREKRTNVMFV